ncbi:hypothetical protein V5799_026342 [Amblyomma americanum]|uniref:Uncharacterized protein n=1 Tax=Amblyomma americanum TaxID=6943 RepID=A0AAQ4DIU9_AMBAM
MIGFFFATCCLTQTFHWLPLHLRAIVRSRSSRFHFYFRVRFPACSFAISCSFLLRLASTSFPLFAFAPIAIIQPFEWWLWRWWSLFCFARQRYVC